MICVECCKQCRRHLYCIHGVVGLFENRWLEFTTPCGKIIKLQVLNKDLKQIKDRICLQQDSYSQGDSINPNQHIDVDGNCNECGI